MAVVFGVGQWLEYAEDVFGEQIDGLAVRKELQMVSLAKGLPETGAVGPHTLQPVKKGAL